MILDGVALAHRYSQLLKEHITFSVGLVAILVGENSASRVYIAQKRKKAEMLGIGFECVELQETISQEALHEVIMRLNRDAMVHGMILQLPLPDHLNADLALGCIDPSKDVDGLHPYNLGALFKKEIGFASCTPQGCIQLLRSVIPDLSGKKVLVIGRSNLVGKPLFHLLLRHNATVTVAHSKSLNLKELCHQHDILVAAIGVPHLIDETYVKDDHIVIDVGITKVDGKLYGDVNFDQVEPIVKSITPVPGGVGPMTVLNLMLNTVIAALQQQKEEIPHVLSVLRG